VIPRTIPGITPLPSSRDLGPTTFTVNGQTRAVQVDRGTPLLWVLRDTLALTGTKYGCGIGVCGMCTVHVDGMATRACTTPLSAVEGKRVTTIEGLAPPGAVHALQAAWIEAQVPQCGWCQSGQLMQAAALLAAHPHPSDAQIDGAMRGVLCRCGTYQRIRRAIHRAARDGG
jgi:aerobic-type carbon monoxide dehydrogenase small subunit (CoxS/CutS family)